MQLGTTALIKANFTHHWSGVISANVNTVKKTNHVLVLLWKWRLLHGYDLNLHGPNLRTTGLVITLFQSPVLLLFPSSSLRLCICSSYCLQCPPQPAGKNPICLLSSGLFFISEKLTSFLLSWFNHLPFCASMLLRTYCTLAFVTLRAEGLPTFYSTQHVPSLPHVLPLHP